MRFVPSTTKHLVLLVAGAAVVLSGPAYLWRQARAFERISSEIRRQCEVVPFSDLELYLIGTPVQMNLESSPEEQERFADSERQWASKVQPVLRFHNHLIDLEEKYHYAASHPWNSVSADPIPPPTPSLDYRKAIRADLDRLLKSLDSSVLN